MDTTQAPSPRRVMIGLSSLLGGVALSAAAVIGVAAGVGAVWHATNPASATTAASPAAASPAGGTSLTVSIENVKTPEGQQPAYVGSNGVGAAVLGTVTAGSPTTVTIVNKTPMPHTFTVPSLGVNETVPPGPATVHFTIDPKQAGLASWQCEVPCGSWVMAHAGYMMGSIKVTA
ncbi:MAG: hypothetical protein M0004_07585 [Actinomycetota bacterium]|nr:hypothetical protein [Actinomycetota bacterium]